jgi:ribosomal protein S27AE
MMLKWEEKGGYLEMGSEAEIESRKTLLSLTKPCPRCGNRFDIGK